MNKLVIHIQINHAKVKQGQIIQWPKKVTKELTMIYITPHRQVQIVQHEPY